MSTALGSGIAMRLRVEKSRKAQERTLRYIFGGSQIARRLPLETAWPLFPRTPFFFRASEELGDVLDRRKLVRASKSSGRTHGTAA